MLGPMPGSFSDAALVLVAHGSTLNSDSATPAYRHGDALRRRKIFGQVQETFWKQEPYVWAVLRGIFCPRVFIVPLFISEGYFTDQVIPRELGLCQNGETDFPRVQRHGERLLHYCKPVGTHHSMTNVLLSRARKVIEDHPFPRVPRPEETALFIAGHGTGNNENSRKAIEDQVALIGAKKIYAEIHAVFMEEEPKIECVYEISSARDMVVVPFFISDGLHSYEDIPVMLGEPEAAVKKRLAEGKPTWANPTERKGRRVWYSESIGQDPGICEVILERVREAVPSSC